MHDFFVDILSNFKENVLNLITEYEFMITHNQVISFRGVQHEVITVFASNLMKKLRKSNSKLIANESDQNYFF